MSTMFDLELQVIFGLCVSLVSNTLFLAFGTAAASTARMQIVHPDILLCLSSGRKDSP